MISINDMLSNDQYDDETLDAVYNLTLAERYNSRLFMDGDQWCILFGDCMMDSGSRIGFGDTPRAALLDFLGMTKHRGEPR
jgi:hypothetical protein